MKSGYSRDDISGMNIADIYKDKENRHAFVAQLKEKGFVSSFETEFITKTGSILEVLLNGSLDGDVITGMVMDVTELKKTEDMLRFTQFAIDRTSDEAFWMNCRAEFIYVNNAACENLGYSKEELLKMSVPDIDPNFPYDIWPQHWQEIKDKKALFFESVHETKTGKRFPVEIRNNFLEFGGEEFNCAFARDISERKYSVDAIRESEAQYRALFENAPLGLSISDQDGNLIAYNKAMLTPGEYTNGDFESAGNIFSLFYDNDQKDSVFSKAEQTGFIEQEEVSLKRKNGGKYFALMSLRAFSIKEQPFWLIMVHDITRRKTYELKLRESLSQLQKTIEGSIMAMMKVVEIRDPYTAGHQERVAELAASIATEMKLSEEVIKGIRMAALIHDIGKICIPYEILGKPTMLTSQEFDIIKTHSKAGYDILKPVDFPWPVADIVHQHHEKLDGSGYPRGLKGNDILLEARVICVADVVEAMATHRPYRPARGVETALNEIRENKGILYAPEVVEACLAVLARKPEILA